MQSRFGFARFHGRFFGSSWPWWWGGLAIGWIGPVFWPYVYYDFFDYVFWPYAYDDFWPYDAGPTIGVGAVEPTPPQRSALDELKDVSAKAAQGLKANCPIYAAVTPTGRIEAMEKRLEATHTAVITVQPALAKFYDGLSDEQKARFNSLRADASGVYPAPAAVVVDQGSSRTGERGKNTSSSAEVVQPKYLDEE